MLLLNLLGTRLLKPQVGCQQICPELVAVIVQVKAVFNVEFLTDLAVDFKTTSLA